MFAEAPEREIYVLLSRSTESESEVRIEIFRRGGLCRSVERILHLWCVFHGRDDLGYAGHVM